MRTQQRYAGRRRLKAHQAPFQEVLTRANAMHQWGRAAPQCWKSTQFAAC
jgi:hypothetical protein